MSKPGSRYLTVDEAVQMAGYLGGAITAIGRASVSLVSDQTEAALEHNRQAGTELEGLVGLLKKITDMEDQEGAE